MSHKSCTRRGCLKLSTSSQFPSPASTPGPTRSDGTPGSSRFAEYPNSCFPYPSFAPIRSCKSVSWRLSDVCDVWDADEWDRTPSEPARKLSYQDLLELKAIQRTLPRADQLPDPYTRKPPSRYLGKVPIGLLPLSDAGSAPGRYPDIHHNESSPLGVLGRPKIDEKLDRPFSDGLAHAPTSPPGVGGKSFIVMPLLEESSAVQSKTRNVMYINGEEVDLDASEEPPIECPTQQKHSPISLTSCSFKPTSSMHQTIPIPPVIPDPITLPACSFRAKRRQPVPISSSSGSSFPFGGPRISTSSKTSPIISIHLHSRSPPSWESGMVRTTRDNTNPSGMVGLAGWRPSEGRRSPPVSA